MLQDDLRVEICNQSAKPCGEVGAPDAGFLFIPDLTDKATGAVLVTLIVLYISSQLVSTLLMSTTADRTQRIIFLALPFFIVIPALSFPAGLLVYWITTNLWTIVQQAIVRKRLGPLRPPGQEGMSLGDLFKQGGGGRGGGGAAEPAPATAGGGGGRGAEPKGRPAGPPPAPPRRKKKRSGRRR
jgi:YidC/Oxa1 family membrane protein insertase